MPPPSADPTPLPMTEAEIAEVRDLFTRTSQANGIVLRLLATMDALTAELRMLRGPTPIPLDRADVKPLLDMMREDRDGARSSLATADAALTKCAEHATMVMEHPQYASAGVAIGQVLAIAQTARAALSAHDRATTTKGSTDADE